VTPLVGRAGAGPRALCRRLLPYKEDTAETLLRRWVLGCWEWQCGLAALLSTHTHTHTHTHTMRPCRAGKPRSLLAYQLLQSSLPPPSRPLLQPEADHWAQPGCGLGDG